MYKILASLIIFISSIISVKAQQWGDYTVYGIQNGTTTYMVDTNGTVVKTWTHTAANKTGYSTYLLPGGSIMRTVTISGVSFSGGPICGKVQKVDSSGVVVWDYVYSTTNYCTHHDICPMPNGNVLLIAYERKTAAEVAAAGCSSFSSEMWPDKIVEVMPTGATTGTVVWEWHAWDHLVQNTNASAANYQSSIVDHPELININYKAQKDWLHMNGVDYNPMLDQITFSSHNMNEIYVIDHSTTTAEAASHTGGNAGKGGDILYRWGNPAAYGASGTAILNVTHDAHWIPEGVPNEGYLVAYNNNGISTTQSCADVINQPYIGNYAYTAPASGAAYLPSTYFKRQASGGYNSNMGSSQQLPNGNTLICIATAGIIKEFDAAGTLLWSKTATGNTPKAFRYSKCYYQFPAPAIPVISKSGSVLSTTAPFTSYQWYKNGDKIVGATSATYTPTVNGIYVVRITDANGCEYQYSSGFKVSDATAIKENLSAKNYQVNVFPNPTNGRLNIVYKETLNHCQVKVTDALGRIVYSGVNVTSIDMNAESNGLYFISFNSPDFSETQIIQLAK